MNALSEGDIISFYSEQSDIRGLLVTHRIVGKNSDGSYITRGDANLVDDSVSVKPENIVGKYTGKARFFIWLSSFVNMRKLLLLLVVIPMTVIAVYEARTVVKIGRETAEKEALTPEEKHEAAMRAAIEKEKKRLEEIGYSPENEVNTIESRETDEEEND